jgi:hypothetical protein
MLIIMATNRANIMVSTNPPTTTMSGIFQGIMDTNIRLHMTMTMRGHAIATSLMHASQR